MAFPAGYTQAANGFLYRTSDNSGPYILNAFGEAQSMAGTSFPLTNSGGQFARVRVDTAQTSFFSGHGFRFFTRIVLAIGATQVVRIIAPINYVLFQNSLELVSGEVDTSVRTGGTPGGSFSTSIPTRRINNMTDVPAYVGQLTVDTGGTHAGGSEINAILVKSSGGLASASSAGNSQQDEIGVAPGTTYISITAASGVGAVAVSAILRQRWEERPTV